MSGFSGEALRKLNKDKSIAIIQEQHVAEVRKLTFSFTKFKSELTISKNITTVLSGRLVQMESQCWSILNTHGENVWKL